MILRIELAIGCMSVNMTKVNIPLEKIMSWKLVQLWEEWICAQFLADQLLGDCLPESIFWELAKSQKNVAWRKKSERHQHAPSNIWPREVSPTQGEMGRQRCRVLLKPSYVPHKRQRKMIQKNWSTLCPDPIPLYIPCVSEWEIKGADWVGAKKNEFSWINLW